MDSIAGSVIKEQIRQKNESAALRMESEIRNQLNAALNNMHRNYKESCQFSPFGIIGGILGIVLAICGNGFAGILMGIIGGIFVWFEINESIKSFNLNLDNQKKQLQNEADNKIRQLHIQADKKTQQEIIEYERDVKMYAQKVKAKAENIAPMVEHTVDMFQRMILHTDSSSNIKFVEADFTYVVMTNGIKYMYRSQYTNPQDDYNFNKERYRDLKSPAECEGLAQALAGFVINKMKVIYPANSINISLNHNDARVTLHFKGANKNFIPAKDIV